MDLQVCGCAARVIREQCNHRFLHRCRLPCGPCTYSGVASVHKRTLGSPLCYLECNHAPSHSFILRVTSIAEVHLQFVSCHQPPYTAEFHSKIMQVQHLAHHICCAPAQCPAQIHRDHNRSCDLAQATPHRHQTIHEMKLDGWLITPLSLSCTHKHTMATPTKRSLTSCGKPLDTYLKARSPGHLEAHVPTAQGTYCRQG